MHQLEQKKLLVQRIVPYLVSAPTDAVQQLLQQSVSDLEMMLEDAIRKKAQAEAAERVNQYAEHACRIGLGRRMDTRMPCSDKRQASVDHSKQPRIAGVTPESWRNTKRETVCRSRPAVSAKIRVVLTTANADR